MKTTPEMFVLWFLADSANDKTGLCCPTLQTISDHTRLHRDTVKRAVREMESRGLLTRVRRSSESGASRSTQYVLNVSPVVIDCTPAEGIVCTPPQGSSTPHNQKGNQNQEPERLADGALRGLESLALECIPPSRRCGAFALDAASARKLAALAAEHGEEKCRVALADCGGAERPVAMLAARLSGKARATGRTKPGAYDPYRLEKPWERAQREAGHSKPWTPDPNVPFVSMAEYMGYDAEDKEDS